MKVDIVAEHVLQVPVQAQTTGTRLSTSLTQGIFVLRYERE